MEQQAETFYRSLAEQAQNTDVRELCLELANEETQHFSLIDDILSRWESLPMSEEDLETMDSAGRLRKVFLSPPASDATSKQIIEYAMNEEMRMVDFYRSFEKEFSHTWKEAKVWEMVAEEMGHVSKLRDMLSGL
jgi:rubrerythrin